MSRLRLTRLAGLTALIVATATNSAFTAESQQSSAVSELLVGATAVDISPTHLPVIVNGMFEERTADRTVDPLFARAFVFDDGHTRIAIVVVDSCMLPRELLDAAKAEASKRTGIPADHILISATHTHSAPSSMGCLGSRPDPEYPAFVVPRLARAIQSAAEKLQPAKIGFAKLHAPNFTYCRRYIRRPDRIIKDPFGEPTVRANMHPGFLSPDAIGPSGPVDDELSLIAIQTADGKPLGVLANFSMHYVGSPMVSSDYFGRFAEHLAKQIDGTDGSTSCIVSMSQGTSGDLASMNYGAETNRREYDSYAKELADLALAAYRNVNYRSDVSLAMREAKLILDRRVPSPERLAASKKIAEAVGDRLPKGQAEIYALEQLMLHAEPQRELKLQAVRIGDIAIAAIPNEVFALTGLKLKLQSPLENTFNIELANGAEGYIPPPEQHKMGGYTTWPARTAALEVEAEPKIVASLLQLLEHVSGKPRRQMPELGGAYATAVLESKPVAYWRLADIAGSTAADASGNQLQAHYGDAVARYLPGPPGTGMAAANRSSHSAHLVGTDVQAIVPNLGDTYSVEFWFWNGLPNDARPVTARLFSSSTTSGAADNSGDQLQLGGTEAATGQLAFSHGAARDYLLKGQTKIQPKTWNHVVLVRAGDTARAFLNGRPEPGLDGNAPAHSSAAGSEYHFGGQSGGDSTLEGKLSDVAVYNRALTPEEIARHFQEAGLPPSK